MPPKFQNVCIYGRTLNHRNSQLNITGSQAARGWNKEKSQKLDEYRAKRLAKGEKKKAGCRVFGEFCVVDTYPRIRPTLRNVKGRLPRWIWRRKAKRKKMVRSVSSKNKKSVKDNSTANPRQLMNPLLARTFASAKLPVQPWSSIVLHLGLQISAKVRILFFPPLPPSDRRNHEQELG